MKKKFNLDGITILNVSQQKSIQAGDGRTDCESGGGLWVCRPAERVIGGFPPGGNVEICTCYCPPSH